MYFVTFSAVNIIFHVANLRNANPSRLQAVDWRTYNTDTKFRTEINHINH